MPVYADAGGFEALLEFFCGGLAGEARHDDAADIESLFAENADQAQHIGVIGDAEVAAGAVLLDIVGVDGDDDFDILLHLQQHSELAVRLEARQNAGGVEVIVELAAEFQIEPVSELRDALADMGGLCLEVFGVIKGEFPFSHDAHSFPVLQISPHIIAQSGGCCQGAAAREHGGAAGCGMQKSDEKSKKKRFRTGVRSGHLFEISVN